MSRRFDLILVVCIVLILAAGFSTLYSIGSTSDEPLLQRQLFALGLGAALFFLGTFFDYRLMAHYSRYIYVLVVLMLALVLLVGSEVRGSSRWLQFGNFNFQPVELAKVILILVLARFLSKKRGEVKSGRVLLHSSLFMAIPVVLVILQPDLGSAALLLITWILMILLSPIEKRHLAALFLILLLVGAAGWFGFLHDYQKERIITFLNPGTDPEGSGYNVNQSIIAVGSGELSGRGLGKGFQSHLRFLPERHTDFIFASFAEEMGFVGSIVLLGSFSLLFWRLIYISKISLDSIGMYFCLGAAGLFIAQTLVNIGMNVGLMPVTGITLPLVSYGGSSLIAMLFMLGIAQNVYSRARSSV